MTNTKIELSNDDDYRASHDVPDAGRIYNQTYEEGYYAALWNKIERPLVETTLRKLGGSDRICLDFACGTGRIANVAAEYFGKVIGVDVSDSMLSCARATKNVSLYNIDLTKRALDVAFDTVTAFRFFLNAERRLRVESLCAIHEHMRDGGSLVCNVQLNTTSPVGLACRMVNRLSWSQHRNTMSIDEISELLVSTGFTVEQVTTYGYMPRPGHLLPKFCEMAVEPVERLALAIRIPARYAQQFLVVARKA